MAKSSSEAVRPFGMRDKIGYMFGDFGNDFTFILSSSFMMVFYTNVMGISAGIVGLLMMLARFVDAFTDVGMGQIVDRSVDKGQGRFRPWIKRMCGPVAIASFLIYQSGFAGMPYAFRVAWMFVTYILWGSIFYTSINIPYGSMASAISSDPKDRSQLSTWRTIGATLAGLVIGAGTPLVAYITVDGQSVLSGSRMTIIAGVFGVCAILCYILCYSLTTERVHVPPKNEKFDLGAMLKSIGTNRALLGIIAAAICLLLSQLTMSGMAGYVFPFYYNNVGAQSANSLVGSLLILVICAPTATFLSARFGKKELSVVACIIAAVSWILCLVIHPTNAYVYLVFSAIAYLGIGYFNTVVWAMITDVIDDAELKNGVREDGTIYSVYSFARKLGQALSSGLTGLLLTVVGYTDVVAASPASYPDVMNSVFNVSCLAPIVGFIAITLCLVFIYPLSKQRVEANAAALAKRRTK